MKILAIETIDVSASLAILTDGEVTASVQLSPKQRSAQYLAPAVKELLESQGWKPSDIDLTAVAQGPGSFTGLRVGITFAKVFAYAANSDLIALNTLDILADALPKEYAKVSIALDAQRGEVVFRNFERSADGAMLPVNEMQMLDFEEWLDSAAEDVYICGPVLARKRSFLDEKIKAVPEEFWNLRAEQIGKTAFHLYQNGRRDDLWGILPIYSRPAAAEERKAEKEELRKNQN